MSPLVDEWLHTDPRRVLPGLSLLAHDGDSQAQLLLGQLLSNGVGASRDPERARCAEGSGRGVYLVSPRPSKGM